MSGPQFLSAIDCLIGGGGEDQELVPLVGEEAGVQLDGDLLVEGQPSGPLDQFEDDSVANAAKFI